MREIILSATTNGEKRSASEMILTAGTATKQLEASHGNEATELVVNTGTATKQLV